MAAVAQAKGIPVESATFEQWDPAGRTIDRVVFAASFHWVDPAVALPKIRGVLNDGGKLALIWNRLRPTNPTRAEFESIYRDYMDVKTHGGDGNPDEIVDLLAAAGFTVTQRRYPHDLHYSAQQWVDIAFTFSNQLILDAAKAAELRARLAERIGPARECRSAAMPWQFSLRPHSPPGHTAGYTDSVVPVSCSPNSKTFAATS